MADPSNGGGNADAAVTPTQNLNHGPGSFAHNNSDQLPGGTSKMQDTTPGMGQQFQQKSDPLAAQQTTDMVKTEAQRRQELTQPKTSRAQFQGRRQSVAPQPVPQPRPDLPHTASVDRSTHFAKLREEDRAARRMQAQEPSKAAPKSREAFQQTRQGHFNDQARGQDQSR